MTRALASVAALALAGCGVGGRDEQLDANRASAVVIDPRQALPAEPARAPPPSDNTPSDKTTARPAPAGGAAACFTQNGVRLTMTPLRAIGTEPFWGARIEGRCVTYSTPEDQAGTRVWTRFNSGPDGGIWAGALGGRQFELRTRPAPPPGCSDGMSDNRYPHHVTLRVGGETRTGCAKPL